MEQGQSARLPSAFVLFVAATFALGVLWSLSTPVMGVPDEPAHVIRAASLVRGDLLESSTVERDGKRIRLSRAPETLVWPKVPCFAHRASVTAACDSPPEGRGRILVEAESSAARYNPVYYALVGLPTLVAPGKRTVYVMRLVTAVLVTGLLALAAIALRQAADPQWCFVGLGWAITPMLLFLTGSVNPNAVEIAAGVALWSTLLSWFGRPDPALDRSRAVSATIAAVALVTTRALAPLFLVLIAVGALLVVPRGELGRAVRAARGAALVAGAVTAACVAWTVGVGTLSTGATEYPEYESLRRYLYSMILSLDDFERQMIGVLGWLDTPLQSHVYSVWFAVLGFLVVAALIVGAKRVRVLLLGLVGLSAAVPIVVQRSSAPELGIIWQGRYLLPVMVGLPLAAGWALSASKPWNAATAGGWALGVPLALLACLQLGAFWWGLHRNVIGLDEDWIGFDPVWQPPLGWMALTALYAVAVATWTYALGRLASGSAA